MIPWARHLCPWDFPGKNIGVGLSFPSPGDLPNPEIKPTSPVLAGGLFTMMECSTEQQQQTNFRVFSKNRLWVTKPESCSCLLSVSLLVAQSCLTLWDPLDYNLPGSSVHGILQARILEWVAISFSRENSWPGDRTWVSEIAGGLFSAEASGKPFLVLQMPPNHRVVTLKRTEFYAAYFTGKNCEHNSFPIDTKSNSKLFRRMNNLYFFFLKK